MALSLSQVDKKKNRRKPKATAKGSLESTAGSQSGRQSITPAKGGRAKVAAQPWTSVGVARDAAPRGDRSPDRTPTEPLREAGPSLEFSEPVAENKGHGKTRKSGTRPQPNKSEVWTMKEQGLTILKTAIGLALEKKDKLLENDKVKTYIATGKFLVEEQMGKYPEVAEALKTRIEKWGVCEKAQSVEAMLREFATNEVVSPAKENSAA